MSAARVTRREQVSGSVPRLRPHLNIRAVW